MVEVVEVLEMKVVIMEIDSSHHYHRCHTGVYWCNCCYHYHNHQPVSLMILVVVCIY